MKTFACLSLIALGFFCCQSKDQSTGQAVDPAISAIHLDGKAVVRIVYSGNAVARPLSGYTNNILADEKGFRFSDTISPGSGYKDIVYDVRSFQKGFLQIGNYGAEVYLAPSDTLFVVADLTSPNKWQVKEWKGKYAFASQYYAARDKHLQGGVLSQRVAAAHSAPDLMHYRQKMDSILAQETAFFEKYVARHPLPQWFVETERNEVRYADAYQRLNTVKYWDFMGKAKQENVPAEYYSFITPKLVNNPKAAHLFHYNRFLIEHFSILLGRQFGKNKADMMHSPRLAQQQLTGKARDMYLIGYINHSWSFSPEDGENDQAKYYDQIANKGLMDQVKAYYREAYRLKPGAPAPAFYLKDPTDSLISLKNYKGNVVYMGFWFVGCRPCIEEMPHENALVEKFKGKPVKIISVCVRSNPENWAKMSSRYGLKTINLFANPSWEKSLIEKYNVNGYPHYVLIDRNGKVVENNCSRPSEDAAAKIEKLL